MAPKRARVSRNDDAGTTSRDHAKLTAEEKGKAPMAEQQEGSIQGQVVARATHEVDPETTSKFRSIRVLS